MLKAFYNEGVVEAGCDEAGRGCLAGPVFAAAVILPAYFSHPLLNDSKKMTARQRDTLREVIEREAVAWAVAPISAERIDEINILNASF
jgi:ribonuclease HII